MENAKGVRVRKENIIYIVRPEEKGFYLAKGFDVIDEKGKVVEEGKKSHSHADYLALEKKIEQLESEIAKTK